MRGNIREKRLVQTPWFYWLVLVIALELIAISVNFFYAPINIAAGGATGLGDLVRCRFWDQPLVDSFAH